MIQMDALKRALQTALDGLLNGLSSSALQRAFVRLSTRSPKDAVDKVPSRQEELVKLIAKELSVQLRTRSALCSCSPSFLASLTRILILFRGIMSLKDLKDHD